MKRKIHCKTYALCEPNEYDTKKKNELKIIWKNIYNFCIKMNFDLIVATDENNGIGLFKNNQLTLPWRNKDDLSFFKTITSNDDTMKAVIMGRNTFARFFFKR